MTNELQQMREYAQMLDCAETREDYGRIYEDMAGYDCAADDPDAGVEYLRELCRGYLKEWADSAGIHCEDVFNPCVTDDERSYGPWGGVCVS